MHPAVAKFVEEFEKEAKERGSWRKKLGNLEIAFLDNVWGPIFEYKFQGLQMEYPFKDYKGGDRFSDVKYSAGLHRMKIELDGYTTHARDISAAQFDDHLERQNDMLLNGWFLLRFSADMVFNKPQICQRQIMQALGRWYYLHDGPIAINESDKWAVRKSRIIRLAMDNGGITKPSLVAANFGVHKQTAADWLHRYCEEGLFEPVRGKQRVVAYRLKQ